MAESPKEESVFDAAEVSEEMPTEAPDVEQSSSEQDEAWSPSVSKESPKDKKERLGEKKESDGEILTIKNVFFTRPKTQNLDGTRIEPKKTQDGTKEYYPGKLGIKFEEENLVEYYPNFHYFVNEAGIVSKFAKINRGGTNAIAKLFKLVVAELKRPEEEISDQEVFDFLVGKKVKMKTERGTYLKKKWFRNDVLEFVD